MAPCVTSEDLAFLTVSAPFDAIHLWRESVCKKTGVSADADVVAARSSLLTHHQTGGRNGHSKQPKHGEFGNGTVYKALAKSNAKQQLPVVRILRRGEILDEPIEPIKVAEASIGKDAGASVSQPSSDSNVQEVGTAKVTETSASSVDLSNTPVEKTKAITVAVTYATVAAAPAKIAAVTSAKVASGPAKPTAVINSKVTSTPAKHGIVGTAPVKSSNAEAAPAKNGSSRRRRNKKGINAQSQVKPVRNMNSDWRVKAH